MPTTHTNSFQPGAVSASHTIHHKLEDRQSNQRCWATTRKPIWIECTICFLSLGRITTRFENCILNEVTFESTWRIFENLTASYLVVTWLQAVLLHIGCNLEVVAYFRKLQGHMVEWHALSERGNWSRGVVTKLLSTRQLFGSISLFDFYSTTITNDRM
jgi:hypothetical protein